jgi:hypothetical protein
LLAEAKRLVARIEHPGPDLIDGIKNCLAAINGLMQRGWQYKQRIARFSNCAGQWYAYYFTMAHVRQ